MNRCDVAIRNTETNNCSYSQVIKAVRFISNHLHFIYTCKSNVVFKNYLLMIIYPNCLNSTYFFSCNGKRRNHRRELLFYDN